jgi:protein ImuB
VGPENSSRKIKDRLARFREIIRVLHKWGVDTLGDLARLNEEELAARLGPEARELWQRASGRSVRVLHLAHPPDSLGENFEFEHEIETIEPLLFILRRLLEQLCLRLQGIYLVAQEVTLKLTFANKSEYERGFKIPQPTRDVELLFRMLQTHLESFQSEQPVVAVSLQAQAARAAEQQFGLFETALRDPNRLFETLARLTGLLGSARVGTPVMQETHRPDVFTMQPFLWQIGPSSPADKPRRSSRAGLRRFRSNRTAAVSLAASKPRYVESENYRGAVVDRKGPYPLSGQWWDDHAWRRNEWDVELDDGAVLRCHESATGWGVDGIYD